jgi:hypothetical protein
VFDPGIGGVDSRCWFFFRVSAGMPSKKASRGRSDATSAADCPVKQDAPETVELSHGIASEPVVKRRKGLGVRVIGGRIYDSVNGKTCHQVSFFLSNLVLF